ncbi:MAG: hypothetical protein PUG70_06725 [Lachnospiraceae bacterium]|nr:hypothetical protein [Lachnospiraceae bacterium]MDY5522191.1 hypothetical protein [Agathobacter sp.]
MKKIKKMIVSILLVAVAITSVIGGSVAEVEAKPKRCTEAYLTYEKKGPIVNNGKSTSMIMCVGTNSLDKFSPFYTDVWEEDHKITASSSKPSVVSVFVKTKNIYLEAKKCGKAIITVKTACGNKFKIKITVKNHNYVKDGYKTECKYCEDCIQGVDVTEEEIYQRIIDAVGEDRIIYNDEVPEHEEDWVCQDWQNWISKKVWGFGLSSDEDMYHRQKLSKSEYKNVRSGDLVFMPNHVCMVVENLHDGRFTVTSWGSGAFLLGTTEEKALELWHSWNGAWVVSYDSSRIDAIYTYYKD